jgi:hypothetical protein
LQRNPKFGGTPVGSNSLRAEVLKLCGPKIDFQNHAILEYYFDSAIFNGNSVFLKYNNLPKTFSFFGQS